MTIVGARVERHLAFWLLAAIVGMLPAAAATSARTVASREIGALKEFKQWIVGCDNGRSCTATAGDTEDRDTGLALALSRQAAGAAPLVMRFALHFSVDPPKTGTVTLSNPKGTVATLIVGSDTRDEEGELVIASPSAEGAILSALRNSPWLGVAFDPPLPEGGRSTFKIPLEGVMAALLWMDERQKRLATTTAFVQPGPRPASTVPSPPVLPPRLCSSVQARPGSLAA